MVKPNTKQKRGHRTYHGKHKNARGGGSRGGHGDVGKCKHHFMRSMLLGTQMGKHGFVRLPLSKEIDVVNVGVLDKLEETMITPDVLVSEGIIKDIGDGVKILGNGDITRSITVKAHAFSASAQEKIEKAKGSIELL